MDYSNKVILNGKMIINNDYYIQDYFERLMKQKGYKFFKNGIYNFNLIAIRNHTNQAALNSDSFNDKLFVIYKNDYERWTVDSFDITTDPGVYYRKHLLNKNGVAVIKPGQYRSLYTIGEYKGNPALIQTGKISVYRDNNLDEKLDLNKSKIQTGYFGINIHSTYHNIVDFDKVHKWSAGCQVFNSHIEFKYFLELIKRQKSSSYSYTLFDSSDLPTVIYN